MAKDWWKTFFDEHYIALWELHGRFKNTTREVKFLVKNLPLKKRDKILDLCCGHGRHSIALAKKGFQVTGLDYSTYELGLARNEAKQKKLQIKFIKGDARTFRSSKKFDVVVNMFTAFGYGTEEGDRKIIKTVSHNLKPRGKFFIDLMNLPWLWRNYEVKRFEKAKDYTIKAERHFDFLTNVNYEHRIITKGKFRKELTNSVRMYTLAQLSELLEKEGMKVVKYWGSYKRQPYTLKSKRMLVLARKV